MKFIIEQVAIAPVNAKLAKELLRAMGATEWAEDTVVAKGEVFGEPEDESVAKLSFNYGLLDGREFEILDYRKGTNWLLNREPSTVSHFGMHCTAGELLQWRAFFKERDIPVAQEVVTQSHTNPHIAGKRTYNYVIFDTKRILGVDLKFIVRIDAAES